MSNKINLTGRSLLSLDDLADAELLHLLGFDVLWVAGSRLLLLQGSGRSRAGIQPEEQNSAGADQRETACQGGEDCSSWSQNAKGPR